MEINKQLFENVLSGKLKGTFVLRNKQIIKSTTLKRSSDVNFPYAILIKYDNGVTDYGTFKSNGDFESLSLSYFDIVDFIPDTNVKENYCLYTYECGSLKIFGRRTTRAKHQTITDAIMEYTKHVEHMTKVNKGKPAFVNKQILVVRYTDVYQSEIVGIIENGHYTCIKEGKM